MAVNKIDESLSINQTLPIMEFIHINYRGEKSNRRVQDPEFWFGETDYHKGMQWMLSAFDVSKQEFRDFAVKDILAFIS